MNNSQSLLHDVAEVFRNPSNVLATTLITIFFCVETPFGIIKINSNALASLIFPVAGTIVALALTAAGLASTFVLKIAADIPEIYQADEGFSVQRKAGGIIDRVKELQRNLLPAWRGTIFVLISFLLSALTLVLPSVKVPLGIPGVRLSVDGFFASASLATVVVGTLWFIPMVRFSFRAKLLDELLTAATLRTQALSNQRPQTR